MEKAEDTTQIEYSEKPSDVEDQNDVEGQDKVNTLEKLDCSSENYRNTDQIKDDFCQGNGTRGNGFSLDWFSDSSLPVWCCTSIQYVTYLSQAWSQVLTAYSLRRDWRG